MWFAQRALLSMILKSGKLINMIKLEGRLSVCDTCIYNFQPIVNIKCLFRFHKQDIPHLLGTLEIPRFYTTHQGSMYSGMEVLVILLHRLSYPN